MHPKNAGTTVKVTTVDGLVDLKIPGGTQPGTTLVMSKRGVPRLGASNSRGDHQVNHPCRNATAQSPDKVNWTASCPKFFYQNVFSCIWSVDSEGHSISLALAVSAIASQQQLCSQLDSNFELPASVCAAFQGFLRSTCIVAAAGACQG